MTSQDPECAAPATYRKCVNRVARTLREPAQHTGYPSDDLEAVIDLIDVKSRERALEWYRRGIRRGFIEACDALLDGQLEMKEGTLYCPSDVVISVRVKFRGEPWERRTFEFTADELEFK